MVPTTLLHGLRGFSRAGLTESKPSTQNSQNSQIPPCLAKLHHLGLEPFESWWVLETQLGPGHRRGTRLIPPLPGPESGKRQTSSPCLARRWLLPIAADRTPCDPPCDPRKARGRSSERCRLPGRRQFQLHRAPVRGARRPHARRGRVARRGRGGVCSRRQGPQRVARSSAEGKRGNLAERSESEKPVKLGTSDHIHLHLENCSGLFHLFRTFCQGVSNRDPKRSVGCFYSRNLNILHLLFPSNDSTRLSPPPRGVFRSGFGTSLVASRCSRRRVDHRQPDAVALGRLEEPCGVGASPAGGQGLGEP